ncbi:hypothetical protein CTI12_AA569390 [Artemisia annua]|uniref:Uncharacterized protein n=1 Tax=Artemisia annua TaxID=35608 RepID=A0A2U1KTU3_ARTAN|nr:hypothetical protein CTI12_AA569390 [Artemisia annua]
MPQPIGLEEVAVCWHCCGDESWRRLKGIWVEVPNIPIGKSMERENTTPKDHPPPPPKHHSPPPLKQQPKPSCNNTHNLEKTSTRAGGDGSWTHNEEEGWTTVNRKKTMSTEKGEKLLLLKFPDNWDGRALWKMFEKYVNLMDVYVAKRRTLGGDRFGFARFKNVININALEKKLATIKIGFDNIVINVARYNKAGDVAMRANSISNNSISVTWNAGTIQHGRSYKEAVARETRSSKDEDQNIKPDMDISVEVDCILNRCLIGNVKEIDTLSNIGHLLMAEGWYDFKIKYLGGLSILIECPSRKALDNILSNDSCWIHKWVSSLSPWREDMDSTSILTWLKVEGIPVHAWMPEVVLKVLKNHCDVLEIEDIGSKCILLNSVSVLVLTKSMEALDFLMPVTINKKKFVLKITEEKHRMVVGGFSSSSTKSYDDDLSCSPDEDEGHFAPYGNYVPDSHEPAGDDVDQPQSPAGKGDPTNDLSNHVAASCIGNGCTPPYNDTSPKNNLAVSNKDTLDGVDE